MPSDSRFDAIGDHFDALVAKYGYSHCGQDYGRTESQQTRFKVLAQATDYTGKTVLDVGCGFADLADYLKSRFERVIYTGVDISREMIRVATERHPGMSIHRLNILEDDPGRFDIVIANGIFYLLGSDATAIMEKLIARMYEIAKEAVVFTSLSARAPVRESGEFHADAAETFTFCQTLCDRVVLRHDYLPHDFTVYMYKPD